jgi:hypothetical protein
MNLAAVLVSICSVFIVCHALRLYLGLQAVFLINTTFNCMMYKKVSEDFSDNVPLRYDETNKKYDIFKTIM